MFGSFVFELRATKSDQHNESVKLFMVHIYAPFLQLSPSGKKDTCYRHTRVNPKNIESKQKTQMRHIVANT